MFVRLYSIALPVFFVIDMMWLGKVGQKFYKAHIGSLMKTDINWVAAISFYLLFIAALVFFVIEPAVRNRSMQQALLHGAFFGFVTYATYDLTNLATLKGWPLHITIIDLLWGTVLAASVSIITLFIARSIHI